MKRTEPERLLAQPAEDVSTLQQRETRLDELDEQLIHEINDTLQAAPRVLNMMQKRLPIMLAKHQIDFRAQSNSTSDMSSADFELHLDPPAAELLRQQREVDRLEDEILVLRIEQSRLEDDLPARGEEQQQQDPAAIEQLDRKIAEAIQKLRAAQAEYEQSRDVTVETEPDHLWPESPILPERDIAEPLPKPPIDPGGPSKREPQEKELGSQRQHGGR